MNKSDFVPLSALMLNYDPPPFSDVLRPLAQELADHKIVFAVVAVTLPNCLPFFEALSSVGRIGAIIPKPGAKDPETMAALCAAYGDAVWDVSRSDLATPGFIRNNMARQLDVQDDETLLVIDIGAYFAENINELTALKNFAGLVEDTENGLQVYEKLLPHVAPFPFTSVARSALKSYGEDIAVGESLARAALCEYGLRTNAVIGVIGFGEVGAGVAAHMRDHGFNVNVVDISASATMAAQNAGHNTALSYEELQQNADMLFFCTGMPYSVNWDCVKPGAAIISCTSRETQFATLPQDAAEHRVHGDEYSNARGQFRFLNHGNSLNFAHGASTSFYLDGFLSLTHAAILLAGRKLIEQGIPATWPHIAEPDADDNNLVIDAMSAATGLPYRAILQRHIANALGLHR